jgi:hypothetical protein
MSFWTEFFNFISLSSCLKRGELFPARLTVRLFRLLKIILKFKILSRFPYVFLMFSCFSWAGFQISIVCSTLPSLCNIITLIQFWCEKCVFVSFVKIEKHDWKHFINLFFLSFRSQIITVNKEREIYKAIDIENPWEIRINV